MAKRTYENNKIRVYWDSSKCVHSANCINGLPEVFNLDKRPWINVNAASAEDIKRVIDTCPTAALRYEMLDQTGAETSIKVLKDGPYLVKGRIQLRQADGTLIETEDCFTLCRCGKTRKPPFCDGTHLKTGFKDG